MMSVIQRCESCGKETAVAGEDGKVEFDLECGGAFWVEVDGERLAKSYSPTESPTETSTPGAASGE